MYVLTRSKHNPSPKFTDVEFAARSCPTGVFRLCATYNPFGFTDEPILSYKRNVFALEYWWARQKMDLFTIPTIGWRRDTDDMEILFSRLKEGGIYEAFVLHDMEPCSKIGFLSETDAIVATGLLAEEFT